LTEVKTVLAGTLETSSRENFPRRIGGPEGENLRKRKAWELSEQVFRALRNPRRRSILAELAERPRLSITEIQKSLRAYGSDHSLSTIQGWYLEPLLTAGLIRQIGDDLELRLLGARIFEIVKQLEAQFQEKSLHCYEEKVLLRLLEGPASYSEVTSLIQPERIARIVNRLSGLISPEKGAVTYRATGKKDLRRLKPGDRIVPKKGEEILTVIRQKHEIQLVELCRILGLAERTAYRYVAWLEAGGLAMNVTQPRQYALTERGRRTAELLEKMENEVMNYPLYVATEYEMAQNKVVSFIDVMDRRGKPTSEINIWENLDLYFTWNFGRLIRLDELDSIISQMEQDEVIDRTYKGFYTLKKAPPRKVLPRIGRSKYVGGFEGGLQQRTPVSIKQ
jgi:predicted transcriptional regulator